MKDLDTVIEKLTTDFNCPKLLMDRIVYMIDDFEYYNQLWEVKKIKGGYNLNSGNFDYDYMYKDFI